jgi:SPP1 gp7 family putative phage head morphogenesis protein
MFKPLLDILRDRLKVRTNSKASLKAALEDGKVQWYAGYFTGPFSASVSKDIRSLGGRWNKVKKAFECPLSALPPHIKAAISSGHAKVNRTVESLYKKIDEIRIQPIKSVDFSDSFDKTISDLDSQFVRTVKPDISVKPVLSPAMKRQLSERYTENLNTYAKDFTDKEYWKLRQTISDNVLEGFRSDRLINHFVSEYGVTKRKAKFLARQETSLMVAKYRQVRYEEVGLTKYKWISTPDKKVRPDHAKLDGKIFEYKNPPVTDSITLARNNPGEDFNCRCIALPILEAA